MHRDHNKPGYDSPPGFWPDECAVMLADGKFICVDAYPHEVSYVRILDADMHEIVYWSIDEFKEDPVEVLGAMFGAAKGKRRDNG